MYKHLISSLLIFVFIGISTSEGQAGRKRGNRHQQSYQNKDEKIISPLEGIIDELENYDHSQQTLEDVYCNLYWAFIFISGNSPGDYASSPSDEDINELVMILSLEVESRNHKKWKFNRAKRLVKKSLVILKENRETPPPADLAILEFEGGSDQVFEDTGVSGSTDRNLLITNTGDSDATILSIDSPISPFFYFSTGSCSIGMVLSPGDSCDIGIFFTPFMLGPSQGTLTVTYDDSENADTTVTANLFGNGI